MEGVTILQTVPTTVWTSGFNIPFLITLLLAVIYLIFSIWLLFDCDSNWFFALLIALFCGFMSFACWSFDETIPGPNKYQVLIDEDVSIVEFTDKYEILSQEGITYWVQDKGEIE